MQPTTIFEVEREPSPQGMGLPAQTDTLSGPSAAARAPIRRPSQLGEFRNYLAAHGLGLLSGHLGSREAGALGILMYHRVVAPPRGICAPTWNVTPARFRSQLEGLLRRGFQPQSLRDVLARHRAAEPMAPKSFVVTFDDGYENVYRHAFPVLRELGIPATIFLTTAYLDSPEPFPFDDWSGKGLPGAPAETWRPLTTAQCHEMQGSGLIELGTHTHVHADYRGRPDELRRDLLVSLDVLRSRFGVSAASYAGPYGQGCRKFDGHELSEAARQAGVVCALNTNAELVRPGDEPYDWGRFTALGNDSAASLAAKLDGWYSLVQDAWRRLRRRPIASRAGIEDQAPATSPICS